MRFGKSKSVEMLNCLMVPGDVCLGFHLSIKLRVNIGVIQGMRAYVGNMGNTMETTFQGLGFRVCDHGTKSS